MRNSLEHPNLPPIIGLSKDGRFLVLPYFARGNVSSYLEAHPDKADKERIQFVRIEIALLPICIVLTTSILQAKEICEVFTYLHGRGITYDLFNLVK